MFDKELSNAAHALLAACKARRLVLATAESCTGGLIAACLTEIPGSSDVFERGFVTYANAAKTDMLGVPADMIAEHGAVSEAVARCMAEGALHRAGASMAISCTGIAGPGGARPGKPVGHVHIAVACRNAATRHVQRDYGDIGRDRVRLATVRDALALALEAAT